MTIKVTERIAIVSSIMIATGLLLIAIPLIYLITIPAFSVLVAFSTIATLFLAIIWITNHVEDNDS